jgi:hypothetical protein
MKILKTILVAAVCLTRTKVKSLPICERQLPAKDVCFNAGKCWQLTDPKMDKVDSLYENGFCYERMLNSGGFCWEKIYTCQDHPTSTLSCYAKRNPMPSSGCPATCTTPHVHDPSYSSKCFNLLEKKVTDVLTECYQKKPCTDPNVIYRYGLYWMKKPDWFRCSQCYAIKTECTGGVC